MHKTLFFPGNKCGYYTTISHSNQLFFAFLKPKVAKMPFCTKPIAFLLNILLKTNNPIFRALRNMQFLFFFCGFIAFYIAILRHQVLSIMLKCSFPNNYGPSLSCRGGSEPFIFAVFSFRPCIFSIHLYHPVMHKTGFHTKSGFITGAQTELGVLFHFICPDVHSDGGMSSQCPGHRSSA